MLCIDENRLLWCKLFFSTGKIWKLVQDGQPTRSGKDVKALFSRLPDSPCGIVLERSWCGAVFGNSIFEIFLIHFSLIALRSFNFLIVGARLMVTQNELNFLGTDWSSSASKRLIRGLYIHGCLLLSDCLYKTQKCMTSWKCIDNDFGFVKSPRTCW